MYKLHAPSIPASAFLSKICLLFPLTGYPASAVREVVSVLDGDTLEVLHHQRAERIRLRGIDCPEKGQAGCFGPRLRQKRYDPDPRATTSKHTTLET